MKKLILYALILVGLTGRSQNLYDIRWTNGGTEYFGFMVFFSEDDVYMRTGYYSANNEYNVVHSEYQYSVDESGDVITMVATSSEFVQNQTDDEWDPDHLFWYKDETTKEWVGPFIISDSDLEAERYENIIEPEFVEVDMNWLNAEYLQFFYYTDEADYKVLLSAGQDQANDSNNNSNSNNSGSNSSFNNGSGNSSGNGNGYNSSFSNGSTNNSNNSSGNSSFSNGSNSNNSNNNSSNNHGGTLVSNGSNTGSNTSTTTNDNTNTNTNTNTNSGGAYGNQPAKLHLIIVANTLISDIGTSTLVDLNNMVGEVTGISEVLGIEMNKMVIQDKNFTKKNVETYMYSFAPGPNDIVIFMYSGHGYRFSNQTEKYPQLDMRYSEYQSIDDNATMNLKQVFDEIVKKGARLNIVLGDCCNSDIGFSRSVGSSFMNSRSSVDPDYEKLKQLFLVSDGDIIAAGASKGEYSWCTMNNGGFFTCSFVGALREEISKFKQDDFPDWGDVMTGTANGTLKKSELCTECDEQHVVYDKFMK
ncbi:MAG: caspase family protein [Crocinitomicaceae bacterium]|nr:caspase family protein [Crocinitomicaceae bacterium]